MILRDPAAAADRRYDLIIVGGGIHGACTLLEAARRGLRALLIERDDFGGATSWNSLRILHGGLRYLQHLDLRRFRESVRERHWFCRNFPDLVRPLPCLMPLYGRGLKRPSVFRVALAANDWLARRRNAGTVRDCYLPGSRVLGPKDTAEQFSQVDRDGLKGGALWYDAAMLSPQRILIEILHWACSLGGTALNYVEATKLETEGNLVACLVAHDRVHNRSLEFTSGAVVNCAGPWCRLAAREWDQDIPALFKPSLAFNVWFDREPLSPCALAIQPKWAGAPVYFTYPFRGRVLAGTFHAPLVGTTASPRLEVGDDLLEAFIQDLNAAAPGWQLCREDVLRVFAGLLPAQRAGTRSLATREVIHDHGRHGGPGRLVSVSGVKFTTARLVAQRALEVLTGEPAPAASKTTAPSSRIDESRQPRAEELDLFDPTQLFSGDAQRLRRNLQRLVREEAVVYGDDLIYRRTDWGLDPRTISMVRERLNGLLGDLGSCPADGPCSNRIRSQPQVSPLGHCPLETSPRINP